MPLFTGKGFSGAAQQGFQQGFAQIVQTLMQDRAAAIQKDLEAQRLDGQFKLQKQEAESRSALADKQIAAQGNQAAFTEGQANSRFQQELLFKKNAASEANSNATTNMLIDQNFRADEAKKVRDANAETEAARRQLMIDESTRAENRDSANRAEDARRFDLTQTANKTRDEATTAYQNKQLDMGKLGLVMGTFGEISKERARIREIRTEVASRAVSERAKLAADRLKDPANVGTAAIDQSNFDASTNVAANMAMLDRIDQDVADQFFNEMKDDPRVKLAMQHAPEEAKAFLMQEVKATREKKKEPDAPKTRTDLGPLPSGDASMSKEQRSAASRGEVPKVFEGVQSSVSAPKNLMSTLGLEGKSNNELRNSFGLTLFASDDEVQKKAKDQVADVWKQFTESKDFNDRIEAAWERAKKYNKAPDSLAEAMSDPKMNEKITADAFGAWWNWRSSAKNSDNWFLTGRYP